MNAAERWDRFDERAETDAEKLFALRADGAIVIFDEDGYFTMEWRDDPTGEHDCDQSIFACDPDGTAHAVYCEPVWLAAYHDHFYEMFDDRSREETL